MANLIAAGSRPTLYRYETSLDKAGVSINLIEFKAIFETAKYYIVMRVTKDDDKKWWIERAEEVFAETGKIPKHIGYTRLRKVAKSSHISHCYVDKNQAWKSFEYRQSHRLWHIKKQLAQAELALAFLHPDGDTDLFSQEPAPNLSVTLGHTDFTANEVNWNEY